MPKKTEKSHASLLKGRVVAYFGSTVTVVQPDGSDIVCHWRRNQRFPVVGDWVMYALEETGEGGVIDAVCPRTTVLMRADQGDKTKPIAANIDYLVIVMVPPPIFTADLVDSYAIAAELLGIQPILVLNKADLMSASEREAMAPVLAVYQNVPYRVFMTSSKTGEGLADLLAILAHHTAVLVGPSGVGKSSLIAKLALNDAVRVGDVSAKGIGKHTTTATRLYDLPDGGALIDSPGVREFRLWPLPAPEVLRAFPEFKAFMTGCQFRDCSHVVEPGCAVQNAVQHGKIGAERFKTFQALMQLAKQLPKTYKK